MAWLCRPFRAIRLRDPYRRLKPPAILLDPFGTMGEDPKSQFGVNAQPHAEPDPPRCVHFFKRTLSPVIHCLGNLPRRTGWSG